MDDKEVRRLVVRLSEAAERRWHVKFTQQF